MATSLIVWMNGRRVGVWTQSRGTSSFLYDPAWAGADDRRRLSLSLDFQPDNAPHKGAVVENYFDNLLPDSDVIRKRLQSRLQERVEVRERGLSEVHSLKKKGWPRCT